MIIAIPVNQFLNICTPLPESCAPLLLIPILPQLSGYTNLLSISLFVFSGLFQNSALQYMCLLSLVLCISIPYLSHSFLKSETFAGNILNRVNKICLTGIP